MRFQFRPSRNVCRRKRALRAVILLAYLGLLSTPVPGYADNKDTDAQALQLEFPAYEPTNGMEAAGGFEERARRVVDMMACGSETRFIHYFRAHDTGSDSSEDMLSMIIGKIAWLERQRSDTEAVCNGSYRLFLPDFLVSDEENPDKAQWDREHDDLAGDPVGSGIIADAANLPWCGGNMRYTKVPNDATAIDAHYSITYNCMRSQVNEALRKMQQGDRQLGSSDLPCYIWAGGAVLGGLNDLFGWFDPRHWTVKGEWDVSVRDLVRVLYLARFGNIILDDDVRDHINHDLINLDLPHMDREDYSWTACGNTENASGDAEERLGNEGFVKDAIDAVGDFWNWMREHWYLLLGLVVGNWIGLAVASGLLPPIVPAIAGVIIAAGATADIVRIPETENHIFNIETSRYLHNQLLLVEEASRDTAEQLEKIQTENKHYLLKHLQRVMINDFEEYNSRPYARYSLTAILNLAEFAYDNDLKVAARNVLDFAAAKAAVGMNEGRRFVPYRRLLDGVQDLFPSADGNDWGMGVFTQVSGADQSVPLMLLYTGNTRGLPAEITPGPQGQVELKKSASIGSADKMIYAATSDYQPPPMILDMAIDKRVPYLERIKHDGVEIYASDPGFLITAGGIEVSADNKAGPLGIGIFYRVVDKGAAVPTTLLLSGQRGAMRLKDLVRIDGVRHRHAFLQSKKPWDQDHNLCVTNNFACGLNIVLPSALTANPLPDGCMIQRTDRLPDTTKFFNLRKCFKDIGIRPVYLAVDMGNCETGLDECTSNEGFFEADTMAVDENDSPTVSLEKFAERLVNINTETGARTTSFSVVGDWHTFNGQVVRYDLHGHLRDSDRTGIEAVGGLPTKDLDDWDAADGPISAKRGEAKIVITHGGQTLTLDHTDVNSPTRSPP
jgi:hypothetical protein